MRSSWIIWVDPVQWQIATQRRDTRKREHVKPEAETEAGQPGAMEPQEPPGVRRDREESSLRAFRGRAGLPTLAFLPSSLQNSEGINLLFQATQLVVICHSSPRKRIQKVIVAWLEHSKMSLSSPTVTLSSLLFLNLAWHLKSRIRSENSAWLSRNAVLPGSFQSVVAAVALSRRCLKRAAKVEPLWTVLF